jgi:hypothetical protein
MGDRSRFAGCLLGLACGDAVGTTVEFEERGLGMWWRSLEVLMIAHMEPIRDRHKGATAGSA